MTYEVAFLEQLRARPGDDVTRLVYADWIDERGLYLRLEVELAGLAEEDPRCAALEGELRALHGGIAVEWRQAAGKRFDVNVHSFRGR